MPKCLINGKEVEFEAGKNIVEVAKKAGVEIPVFCYHPGLTVVAQCRMCYVEVGTPGKDGKVQMIPKLQTACSTAATEGMVVLTQSEKVKKGQKATMEFLLLNHPLDCPICDKSGECDLQDNSFKYGDAYMRHSEERRTYVDLDMGPVIQKNMNRCIHCTRCIRFGAEIAGIREMVAIQRGNNTEITTIDGKELQTEYAGNYADICPTGSLTLKDFRFHKRAWMLKKTPTICEGCSRGCNMEIHHQNGVLERCIPRENMEINRYWLCDEGRFHFRDIQNDDRVTTPMIAGAVSDWNAAIAKAKDALKGKKTAILIGTDLTTEEAKLIKETASQLAPGAQVFHFGTPGVNSVAQDGDADKLLKRKSKTANLNGIETLGIKPLESLSGVQAVMAFGGGRAVMPELSGVSPSNVVAAGVFFRSKSSQFAAVLPGLSFYEKSGSVTNFQNKEQKFVRAVASPKGCKPLSEILMTWVHQDKSGVA